MERMIVNLADVDITGREVFADYAAIKKYDRPEQNVYTYLPPEIKARNEAVVEELRKMSPEQIKRKADELIRLQQLEQKHNELIDHMAGKGLGNYSHFNSLWSPMIWQAREDNSNASVVVNGKTIKVFDIDYIIAESLQRLYSSEDPVAEYHDWVAEQKKIEVAINANGATEDEIAERNAFIGFLDERETEIKRIIFLYAGSALNPNSRQQTAAQEKIKFLTFKLSELRRLRERTSQTKSHADSKEYFERQEAERQRVADAAVAGFVTAGMAAEQTTVNLHRNSMLEHGLGESLLRLRPEPRTREQVERKLQNARKNREQVRAMLEAMRYGLSKDEWLELQRNGQTANSAADIRSRVRLLRGFDAQQFREYTGNETA